MLNLQLVFFLNRSHVYKHDYVEKFVISESELKTAWILGVKTGTICCYELSSVLANA